MATTMNRKYRLISRVHPETIVRWFLEIHHYWFDESIGPNAFAGMRDDAFNYLSGWIETGELSPDKTLLEIQVAAKFQEWFESSWRLDAAKCLAVRDGADFAIAERCTFDMGHNENHSWASPASPIDYTKPHVFDLDRQTGLPHVEYEICKCGLSKQNAIHI